jgi:hypothetical protein
MTQQASNAAAEGCSWAEKDEQEESEDGGRQDKWQGCESFDNSEPAAAAQNQDRCQRHGYGEQNGRGDRGQL